MAAAGRIPARRGLAGGGARAYQLDLDETYLGVGDVVDGNG